MQDIIEFVSKSKIIKVAVIIILASIVYLVIKKTLKKIYILNSHSNKINKRKQKTIYSLFQNIIKYIFIMIVLLIVLDMFGINTSSIIAGLGVVGVVIGLAFQDVIKDFLSGITILFEDQYAIGDTISVNGFKGEVIFLGLKTTKIKAFTGEIIIIANRNISEVINYSLDSSLAIVDIPVSYETDVNKVEKILQELCKDLTNKLSYLTSPISVLGIQELSDSSVKFRIIVSTESMKHFDVQREILKQVKIEFDKKKIKIPYPQIEVHNG